MPRRLLSVALVILGVFAVGCGGSGVERVSGVRSGAVTTLALANGNFDQTDLQPWVDAVRSLSKGRLRIAVSSGWRNGEAGYEAGLIADVRAGRAQLGWVAPRALTSADVHSFDALNVPFLVDSYAIEEAVLRSAGEQMLAGVTAAGVVPVAVLPGPLRLLLTRRPVRGPGDLAGLRIGVQPSAVGERGLRIFGVRAMPIARGGSIAGLDGVEQRLGDLAATYVGQAPYLVADAPLWPRAIVLFANRAAWASLSPDQRAVLRDAAARAFAQTLRNAETDDRTAMRQLCDGGVRLVTVGARGRATLRAAVAPVADELRRDAAARSGLEAVERARADAAAPEPLTCEAKPVSRVPALTGTFMWTLHRGERGSQYVDFDHGTYVRFRLELGNGRAVQTAVFSDGHSELGLDEKYSVYRDRITFGGDHGPPDTARWRLDGDRLRFSEFSQADPAGQLIFTSHLWIRVRR